MVSKQLKAAVYLLFTLDMDDTDEVMALSGATAKEIEAILSGKHNGLVYTGGAERYERIPLRSPVRCKCGVRIKLVPCQYCRCGGMLDELLGRYHREFPNDTSVMRTEE